MQAEMEGAFHIAFYVAELVGREEAGGLTRAQQQLLRLLTPVMKLTTAKQAVLVASETLEAFGGAGYVEDTGLPVLLRDSQVLPIWEGTTNVLALDALRVMAREAGAFAALAAEAQRCAAEARAEQLIQAARLATEAVAHAETWLAAATKGGQPTLEAGARRLALTLGRALSLALLVSHAQWSLDYEQDARAAAAAKRYAQAGIDLIVPAGVDDALALMNDR